MRVVARVYFLFSKASFSSRDLLLQHKSGPMVIRSRVRDLPTPPCEPFPPPPLFPPVIPLFHPIRPSIFVRVFLFDPLLFTGSFTVCWNLSLARDFGSLPLSFLQDGCCSMGGETFSGRRCSSW